MRIEKITIEGLFGMFNHTIPLNTESGLTILYGENGVGKTTVFKILDALFKNDIKTFVNLPYSSLRIELVDGYIYELEKTDKELSIQLKRKGLDIHKKENYIIDFYEKNLNENIRAIISAVENKTQNHHYTFITSKRFPKKSLIVDTLNKKEYSITDFIIKYNDLLETDDFKIFLNIKESLILKRIGMINSFFINTQRILTLKRVEYEYDDFGYGYVSNDKFIKQDTVEVYSEELAKLLQQKHQQYSDLSEKLESSLSQRLIKKEVKTDFTREELKQKIEKVEKRRDEFEKVGLLTEYNNDFVDIDENVDAVTIAVLAVNVQDLETKLAIFDDIYLLLDTFLDVINNKRFAHKTLLIDRTKGFIFKNSKGERLFTNQLSSGEQHELILMYQLLFKIPEGTLILIDEPEISLHVMWQKEFVTDMLDIIKLRKFDIMVATHSPSIINGNWDYTVALKGEEVYD